jgi:hypothetical protein
MGLLPPTPTAGSDATVLPILFSDTGAALFEGRFGSADVEESNSAVSGSQAIRSGFAGHATE